LLIRLTTWLSTESAALHVRRGHPKIWFLSLIFATLFGLGAYGQHAARPTQSAKVVQQINVSDNRIIKGNLQLATTRSKLTPIGKELYAAIHSFAWTNTARDT